MVINLVNHWSYLAQQQWAAAGFTGTVTFNPVPPPDYKVKWQSLSPGTVVSCTTGITVRDAPP